MTAVLSQHTSTNSGGNTGGVETTDGSTASFEMQRYVNTCRRSLHMYMYVYYMYTALVHVHYYVYMYVHVTKTGTLLSTVYR